MIKWWLGLWPGLTEIGIFLPKQLFDWQIVIFYPITLGCNRKQILNVWFKNIKNYWNSGNLKFSCFWPTRQLWSIFRQNYLINSFYDSWKDSLEKITWKKNSIFVDKKRIVNKLMYFSVLHKCQKQYLSCLNIHGVFLFYFDIIFPFIHLKRGSKPKKIIESEFSV